MLDHDLVFAADELQMTASYDETDDVVITIETPDVALSVSLDREDVRALISYLQEALKVDA